MRQLLSHSQFGGGKIPIDFIFAALKDELLAQNYVSSYQYSLDSIMPQQRWEDWLRVNDRVVLEVAAIPAQQFVVDVPEPTESELSEFFEQYRNNEPLPQLVNNTELPSPNPGFATPQKVRIQYVKADYNSAITQLTDDVTDEEIAKYYEDNKELFLRADSGFDSFDFEDDEAEMNEDAAEKLMAKIQAKSQPLNRMLKILSSRIPKYRRRPLRVNQPKRRKRKKKQPKVLATRVLQLTILPRMELPKRMALLNRPRRIQVRKNLRNTNPWKKWKMISA